MPGIGAGGASLGFKNGVSAYTDTGTGNTSNFIKSSVSSSVPADSPSAETVSGENSPMADSSYYESRINGATDFASLINSAEKISQDERAFNAAQADLAYQRNRSLALEAYERAKQARLDEYSDMVESLRRAGLNPYLAYERSPTSVAGYQASAPSSSYSGFASSVAGASSSVLAAKLGFAKTTSSAVLGALAKIVSALVLA